MRRSMVSYFRKKYTNDDILVDKKMKLGYEIISSGSNFYHCKTHDFKYRFTTSRPYMNRFLLIDYTHQLYSLVFVLQGTIYNKSVLVHVTTVLHQTGSKSLPE